MKPGDIYLTPYERELWPVMLCKDDMPPKQFMDTKPNGYVSAAILLGKRIYKWVARNQLHEFNEDQDYIDGQQFENNDIHASDSNQEKLKKLRRIAFTVDVKETQTPEYWKNFIVQRSETRKLEQKMANKAAKRQRSQENNRDDDDIEFLGVRPRSSSSSPGSSEDKRRRTGGKHPPTPESNPKKRRRSTTFGEELDGSEEELFVREAGDQSNPFILSEDEQRERNLLSVTDHPPTDDRCTIFVGPEQTPFQVPKDRVGDCDFLADRTSFTEELRSHVDLSEMTNLNAKEFSQVWNYMEKGDFTPRLVKNKFGGYGLEKIVLQEEKDNAAIGIARAYVTAAKIKHSDLQSACVGKLQALYPLSSKALMMVLMIFMKAEDVMDDVAMESEGREWLIDHVVEQFWNLVKQQNLTFARFMGPDRALKRAILEKLGQNPMMAVNAD